MNHFLAISDLSSGEVQDLLDLAIKLKEEYFKKGNPPYFKGKVLGMIFQKPSLRTRVSFDMAMRHCGGDALYLSPNEIGLGKRESIADIARVLSGYVQALMARTFDHEHVLRVGAVVGDPGGQWLERLQPSLPGHGRCAHHPGKVRQGQRLERRLRG